MMRTMIFTAALSAMALVGCQSDCHRNQQCGCNTGCVNQVPSEPVGRVCVSKPPCNNIPNPAVPDAGPPCVSKPAVPPCAGKPGTGDGGIPAPKVDKSEPPTPAPLPKQVNWQPAEPKFGHAKDFSWLRGQLRHVHVTGGSWKIRYKPLDEQDKWGGSVVLSEDARIDKFRDGDFVYVTGEIIRKRPTVYLAGPLYRVTSIRLMTQSEIDRTAKRNRLQGTSIRK